MTTLHIKIHSLLTTMIFESTSKAAPSLTILTKLIYQDWVKNIFITGYVDCADFREYVKNSFIGNYAGLRYCAKYGFINDYADYTDIQGHVKNGFIIDHTDYANFRDYLKNNFITDDANYSALQITITYTGFFFRKFNAVLDTSLAQSVKWHHLPATKESTHCIPERLHILMFLTVLWFCLSLASKLSAMKK